MFAPSRIKANVLPRTATTCFSCCVKTGRTRPFRPAFSTSTQTRAPASASRAPRPGLSRQYFSANSAVYSHNASAVSHGVLPTPRQEEDTTTRVTRSIPDHAAPQASPASPPTTSSLQTPNPTPSASSTSASPPQQPTYPMRPDAPSRLTSMSSDLPTNSLRRRLLLFLSLSKPRLSFLVVLTTAVGYALYPVPPLLTPTATSSPSLSALTLVFLTTGTALCCASANSLNMLLEPAYDAQMSRTRNRPLVRGLLSKRAALLFAIATGVAGTAALYLGVNPTVSGLGALNILLYAGVYTPLKRMSVVNTWVGALVGGIPPLMGWAAAAGQAATADGGPRELLGGDRNGGAWLLAALLFAWQFAHFNALSWGIRDEYRRAGYKMLVSFRPNMNGRVALRYSLLMVPICFGLSYKGVTDQAFALTSSVVNVWLIREAFRFWWHEGHKGTARSLFWASVWHLPVVMVLAMAHKNGLWEGIWRRTFGEADDDDGWLYEDDEGDVLSAGDAAKSGVRATTVTRS